MLLASFTQAAFCFMITSQVKRLLALSWEIQLPVKCHSGVYFMSGMMYIRYLELQCVESKDG